MGIEYCLAVGFDNKNTNFGDHNSIKSRTLQKIIPLLCPVVYVISCIMLLVKLEVFLSNIPLFEIGFISQANVKIF